MKKISLIQIEKNDRSTQARLRVDSETLNDYRLIWEAADKKDGCPFDSHPVVFFDSRKYWIADGWHRILAAEKAKRTWVEVDVRNGTRREALTYALGANERHGLRRSKADKRNAALLAIKTFPDYTDQQVADVCRVSRQLITKIRAEERQPTKRLISLDRNLQNKLRSTIRAVKQLNEIAPNERCETFLEILNELKKSAEQWPLEE